MHSTQTRTKEKWIYILYYTINCSLEYNRNVSFHSLECHFVDRDREKYVIWTQLYKPYAGFKVMITDDFIY